MNIKTKQAFTTQDSGGALTSYEYGQIYAVGSTLGNALISAGLAEEYTGAIAKPYGDKSISENGTYDISEYANAVVNVGIYTVSYNANGGTGTVASQTVIAGNEIELSDGTGLTAPEDKEFAGWATEDDATEPDVTSPYKPTGNVTLYAVYVAE